MMLFFRKRSSLNELLLSAQSTRITVYGCYCVNNCVKFADNNNIAQNNKDLIDCIFTYLPLI